MKLLLLAILLLPSYGAWLGIPVPAIVEFLAALYAIGKIGYPFHRAAYLEYQKTKRLTWKQGIGIVQIILVVWSMVAVFLRLPTLFEFAIILMMIALCPSPKSVASSLQSMLNRIRPYLLPIAFLQAVVAMAGSLYFSEVLHYVPCVLCWYQRITLYPVVALTLIAMWRKDEKVYQYILPLSVIGFAISLYHNVLYYAVNWNLRPDWVGPCQAGISCTTAYWEVLGFVTIPFLSLVAHGVITVLMALLWKAGKKG